jgi:hypothetical protein
MKVNGDAAWQAGEDMQLHRTKRVGTAGVRDDPIGGRSIADDVGLAVAFGGWHIIVGGQRPTRPEVLPCPNSCAACRRTRSRRSGSACSPHRRFAYR